MIKEDVTLMSVTPDFWTSNYERLRGFKRLARVKICYYALEIHCELMVGNKANGSLFHYLSMPYFLRKSFKRKMIVKQNYFNWPQKESDEFQAIGLQKVLAHSPDLFKIDPSKDEVNKERKGIASGKK